MLIKTVTTIVATDSTGKPVDAMPVREVVAGETDITGRPVSVIPVTEDAAGVPVRFVTGKSAVNSAAQVVDSVPVIGGIVDPFASSIYDLDFRSNTYKGATLTAMLAEVGNFVGGLYELESDGSLVSVASSVIQRTGNGLEVWPNSWNRVQQCRNLTTTPWVLTGCTAARSTGRNGSANAGSRLTLTDVTATATQPAVTVASGPQIVSLDVKAVVGTPTLEVTVDNGATWVNIGTASASWQRLKMPASQTVTNPQFGIRLAGSISDQVDIDYVQMEPLTTVTPRIATTTASVNRPQNRATCLNKPPLVDLIKTNTYTAYWEGIIDPLSGRGIYVSDAGFTVASAVDGSIAALGVPAGEFQMGQYQKIAFSRTSGGTTKCSVNGGPIRTGSLASHAALTHFDISTNGAGTSNGRGKVRRCTFWSAPISEANLQAISALS